MSNKTVNICEYERQKLIQFQHAHTHIYIYTHNGEYSVIKNTQKTYFRAMYLFKFVEISPCITNVRIYFHCSVEPTPCFTDLTLRPKQPKNGKCTKILVYSPKQNLSYQCKNLIIVTIINKDDLAD